MNVTSAPGAFPDLPNPRIHSGMAPAAQIVTITPSRRSLQRTEPSLSFTVSAPGFAFFDVILATDPKLFHPEEAHRRTPRNFRSSRQDFEGLPIDLETGLYMVPRAFIHAAIQQEPRPDKLHYIAVAYADETATDGEYSMHRAQFGEAPYVILGADLTAVGLSRILGMSVHRLGSVSSAGRVMQVQNEASRVPMPRMIGGLPVASARPNQRAPLNSPSPVEAVRPTMPPLEAPAPQPNPHGAAARPIIHDPTPMPPRQRAEASEEAAMRATPPPPAPPEPQNGGFIDEDYAAQDGHEAAHFVDRDAPTGAESVYDDGLGPLDGDVQAFSAPPPEPAVSDPIPPLDDVPQPGAAAAQPGPAPAAPAPVPAPPAAEEANWKDNLVQTLLAEGVVGRYEALNLDGAFRGRMGADHPYHQVAHDGLSIGPHQANQDSGELGELLALMQAADPASFASIMGEGADAVLQVTSATGPASLDSPGGRSARVQPVMGRDLWEDPWLDKFRALVKHPPFQAAMRAQIITRRLEPMLPVAEALGFDGARGRAQLLAMALMTGVQTATSIARAAANPFDTPAKLASVLEALGAESLQAYQASKGLATTEVADDQTHFSLLQDLRALGPDAPVQVPDPETIMDMLVTTAGPGPIGDALLKLRVSVNLRQRGA